jgi:flagellar basal-body rod protein FlgG
MVYGLYLSADGLLAQQYRQDVIANNLANVDTPGFKADRVAFSERLTESMLRQSPGARQPALDPSTGGLFGTPVYTDYAQGNVIPSSSPFDLAILDNGFLAVQTPDGARYTRDGRLVADNEGTLRHVASGGAVLGADGQPIVIDPAAKGLVRIDESGRISQGDAIIGKLGLVDFQDRQALEKAGQNLYDSRGTPQIAATGQIKQGAYEASGVEPATALVDMISAARAYEMNVSLISMQDESLGRAVNEVGRIG